MSRRLASVTEVKLNVSSINISVFLELFNHIDGNESDQRFHGTVQSCENTPYLFRLFPIGRFPSIKAQI